MMVTRKRSSSFIACMIFALLAMFIVPAMAAPKKAPVVAGVITGPSGPVVGALVTAYALPGATAACPQAADTWKSVASTTSGRSGAYSLPLSVGSYRLGVTPPPAVAASFGYRVTEIGSDGSNVTSWVGFADDVLVPTAGLIGVDVKLSTPRSITGVVRDSVTNAVLPGIEVRAVAATGSQTQLIAPMITTKANGTYALSGLPNVAPDPNPTTPGENEALRFGMTYIDPTGFHSLWLWWWSDIPEPDGVILNNTPVVDLATSDTNRDVVLRPSGRVTGVITDAKGRPLAGIAVEPWTAYPYPARYSDSKGRFSVEDTQLLQFRDPAGVYRTTYTGGYQYPYQAQTADPTLGTQGTPGTTRISDVKLLPGNRIVGTVIYSAQAPGAGAAVHAWEPGGVNDWMRTAGPGVPTNCDGTYSLTGLWPGTYNVTFGPMMQYTPSTTMTVTIAGSGTTVNLGQTVLPSWIITGQVGANGDPVIGVVVDLMGMHPQSNGQMVPLADYGMSSARAVITDSSGGNFRVLTTMQTGSLQLRVHDPSGTWADRTVDVDDPDSSDATGPFFSIDLNPVP